MNETLRTLYTGVLEGETPVVVEQVQRALADREEPAIILQQMISAMDEVGRRFESGEYYPPEMLIAARAMQAGMALLKPHLLSSDIQSAGKIVIGTVQGDLHDIGKNLVSIMLEGAGFEIQDLGVDVLPEKFVAAIQAGGVNIVALSALLTTTMPNMKTTIEALKSAGVRDQVKIMVGGAPVTETYARQIGADGYAPDASRAVGLAKSLVQV